MADARHNLVRKLPSVDKLMSEPALAGLDVPRSITIQAIRQTLEDLRSGILAGNITDLSSDQIIVDQARELALQLAAPSLRKVINATGIVLHTGLGRAVLPEAACDALQSTACAHSNLETDMESGMRGSRQRHFDRLLAELCGAEAGFAINNNAAAVLLALNTLAIGMEVIVSRGQLVEIGGSFRLPDIMARAGARLVEVGTTNRTRIKDYEAAISPDTALILRVHTSNFRVVGFTEEASIEELVDLGRRHGIPVMDDAGSGALIDMAQFGLRGEPLTQDSIRAGVDVVTFSGDKLLGGPQAGLIVGRRDLVDAMMKNPLARALRIGKLTIAALEATLRLYLDPETITTTVPTLKAISRPIEDIERSARKAADLLSEIRDMRVEIIDGFSEVGGGSLPGQSLPTRLVALTSKSLSPLDLARELRLSDPPVFGRVGNDLFLLDMRTVDDAEIPAIAKAAGRIFAD